MLQFSVETLDKDLIDEMLPMQQAYRDEVAGPFHNFKPDVKWAVYLSSEQMGFLKVVTARDTEGILRGAAFILIHAHLHYDCIEGTMPLFFLHPDFRLGREGLKFLKVAERVAAQAGVQLFVTHGTKHNGVTKIYERTGYGDLGSLYFKILS